MLRVDIIKRNRHCIVLHVICSIKNFTDVYSAEIVLGAVARQYFQPDAS